jgi:predicted DNA-binding transcriptional regulator
MFMNKDQGLGWLILVFSVLGIALYYYLVFMSAWSLLTIQVSAFLAVAMVLLIIAWIGYTLATTPPPMPLEDFDMMDQEATIEDIKQDETSKIQ